MATGVPLLALRADRAAARRDARRGALPLPAPREDSWAFRRRHRLTDEEVRVVEQALRSGERVPDPRLRALTVERATALLAQVRPRPGRRTWAAVAVLAVALGVLLVEVPPHDPLPFVALLNLPLQLGLAASRRRRLRLALGHNSSSAG